MTASSDAIEVVVNVSHDEYSPRSEAWERERRALTDALMKEPEIESVRRVESPVENTRGGISEVVVAIASSGALPALVLVARAWITRDKARGVELVIKKGKTEKTFKVKEMRDSDMKDLIAALSK